MREIKFRGMPKMTDRQAMVFGWGCHTDENERKFIIVSPDEFIQVENIQQYTGLKDKNGKEIYEGDIAKGGEVIYQVGFNLGTFELQKDKKAVGIGLVDTEESLEVIGNIYENPELRRDK